MAHPQLSGNNLNIGILLKHRGTDGAACVHAMCVGVGICVCVCVCGWVGGRGNMCVCVCGCMCVRACVITGFSTKHRKQCSL